MKTLKKCTGTLQVKVDLANEENPKQSDHLPHERDESTESQGQPDENDVLREDIHRAYEDTQRGLRDTDLRGIPSNIKKSRNP